MMTRVLVPVSVGELVDKITILEIKLVHIPQGVGRSNVLHELSALREVYSSLALSEDLVSPLRDSLREVNSRLWDIEDDIRICERDGVFSDRFIELARSVYLTNDKRAEIKRQLNDCVGSEFREEKYYSES